MKRRHLIVGTLGLGVTAAAAQSTGPTGPTSPATPPVGSTSRPPPPPPGVRPSGTHRPFGPINPPEPAPALPLVGSDGRRTTLPALLRGRVTALQLMFTGCSATCPIQGAVFAAVAPRIKSPDVRLLSISIDPLHDDPKALRDWIARHGAHPIWSAAAPRVEDVDKLLDFFRGRTDGPDPHMAKAYVFDRQGRYIFKSPDLPSVEYLQDLMAQAAARP